MISSMTGFGKGTAAKGDLIVEAELKSVNSRYLEISFKLPKSLQSKEYELRELIRNKIKRGKLIVGVAVKKNGAETNKLNLDVENLKSAVSFLQQIKESASLKGDITIDNVLEFQQFLFAEDERESEQEFELLAEALEKAVDQLSKMRDGEGQELEKDLRKRIQSIGEIVGKIEEANKQGVIEQYDKLKERAKSLLGELEISKERMDMELALLVDKSDITEECVRLKSHTKFFLENLNNSAEVGRKLNFLCQEINREANTIGNKTLSSEVSHFTVFIKEELEKIREQLQNIE